VLRDIQHDSGMIAIRKRSHTDTDDNARDRTLSALRDASARDMLRLDLAAAAKLDPVLELDLELKRLRSFHVRLHHRPLRPPVRLSRN
jgi:hypothetical protein